jgi:hypothetical protein
VQEDRLLQHIETIREDVRDEVKRRIQQRDQYSMQLTVALGAIAVGAYSSNGTPRLFIIAPLVAIYFTALILYSYRIHDLLASYLREEIEPMFKDLTGLPTEKEWECWYHNAGRKPGIRRWFFAVEMITVTLAALCFLWQREWSIPGLFHFVLVWSTFAYPVLVGLTLLLLPKNQ